MRTGRTTWSLVVVVFAVIYGSNASLNLYISKDFANNELAWNFESDLYIIRDGEPAALLKNPQAFTKFMAPLPESVLSVKFQWYSSPQMSKYSMRFESSDERAVPVPRSSLPLTGVCLHATTDLIVSFDCTGEVGGTVELSMLLNYTKIQGSTVQSDTSKSFKLTVNKVCEKTEKPTKAPSLSRGVIVGICGGITLLLCLSLGAILVCRHTWKQRKLRMEFEDDLESKGKRSESVYKMPSEQENAGGPTVTPVYSPPRQKSQVQARRGRLGTNSSLTELIVDHDEEVQVVLSPPQHNEKHSSSKWTKPLSPKESDGGSSTWPSPNNSPPSYETEALLEPQIGSHSSSVENMFLLLNEAWATELSEVLIHRGQVDLLEPIKRGTFGCVYKGRVRGLDRGNPRRKQEVSVKVLQDKTSMDTVKSFAHEAIIMKDLLHPNVSPLLGVALQRAAPPLLVMPLTKRGDLGHLLKLSRPNGSRLQKLTSRQLINLGVQIASGMEYIAHKHIIHRNLSSRTCVVEEDLTAKITDFSLAQMCPTSSDPDFDVRSRIQKKWSAPESLQSGVFSEKTDVWSFGVILWELVSLGKKPYQDLDEHTLESHLLSGYRLGLPKNCPDQLYSLMKSCWSLDAEARSTFSCLLKGLELFEQRLILGSLHFELAVIEPTC